MPYLLTLANRNDPICAVLPKVSKVKVRKVILHCNTAGVIMYKLRQHKPAQQSVTRHITLTVLNLVTPEAAALLFVNKITFRCLRYF